ncbi:RES family NAD+ phosphorylase [Rhodoplanes sp. TEM]|uniref:RES family NAD+ phosphorylase n=1 Tax=Rhodoplanes tepidamans TaxID=200616 RepID=A0ABT5J7E2_RHOTP|nr:MULTISPECIES: RES family NAD+ phosphorylase [Rhodoplanes]MDC7785301.1 RES family NAD+ phosphorylase [Rhodoplanes tepidamans]MDC7987266.1 RES family NAD+ phosphorylase [Rhodoplanes sp. TEM]MDQ0353559.1 hypothetical protein [Rhodoplanes tepidamans]
MKKRLCCPECFDDHYLRNEIFRAHKSDTGTCDFCGTSSVDLIDPTALHTYFELLANAYELNDAGKSLVEWMKEDWLLFSHPNMDAAHAKDLLGDIFDDGDIARNPFAPLAGYKSDGLVQWETLRDEMMYKNRWFIDVDIDTARLEQLLDLLVWESRPSLWYRARISPDGHEYPADKMGAPPKRQASHGRANPAGIPYLYLGSKPETAISEVRPHTGETACVAEYKVPKIRTVDLRSPRKTVSPFMLSDATEIGQLRADLPLLEQLGEELTRPVLPQGAAIDYIPSQYLCEFIKKRRFDGVIYRSSVSDGINLALFDPDVAACGKIEMYSVTKVMVSVSRG